MSYFKPKHARIWQNLLYLCALVCDFPDGGVIKAETCGRAIISDKWLFINDYAVGWFIMQLVDSLLYTFHSILWKHRLKSEYVEIIQKIGIDSTGSGYFQRKFIVKTETDVLCQ
jgi:hypothetical protein